MIIEICKLTKSESVPMSDFRHIRFYNRRRHCTLHHTTCRIDMVYYIKRRRIILHLLKEIHQPEYIFGIIEVSGSDILNFHHHGTQSYKFRLGEFNMVGKRGQLCIARREYDLKISSFTKNIIHISSSFCIPAVLGTEAADRALMQGSVHLVFQ